MLPQTKKKTTNKNIKLQNAHFSLLDEMKTKMCSTLHQKNKMT